MKFEKADLEQAGAAQSDAAVREPKPEPTAVEKLESAQTPLKRNYPEGALSPEILALLAHERAASAQAAGVAVQEALANILPALIDQIKKPSPKEEAELAELAAKAARDRREMQQQRIQNKIERDGLRQKRAACPHLDHGGVHSAIALVHNQIQNGGRVAGLCMVCNDFIQAAHYELLPPTNHTVTGGMTEAEAAAFIHELEMQGQAGVKIGPTDSDGYIRTIIIPAHKDYKRVLQQEAAQGA